VWGGGIPSQPTRQSGKHRELPIMVQGQSHWRQHIFGIFYGHRMLLVEKKCDFDMMKCRNFEHRFPNVQAQISDRQAVSVGTE